MNNKLLLLVPASSAKGGISYYFETLRSEFPPNIEYHVRGTRSWPKRTGFLPKLLRIGFDYKEFQKKISKGNYALIQTSTSLGIRTFIRDGIFLLLARRKGIKTIVFFRGWNDTSVNRINRILFLFKLIFFRADKIITLSEKSKSQLLKWGYKKEIIVETTVVNKNLINDLCENEIALKYTNLKKNKKFNFLFLSRTEKRKGIFELLEAFRKISLGKTIDASLTICGDGSEMTNVKNYIDSNHITNVKVTGFVENEKKRKALWDSHALILPSYEEGMPNSVLEAFGFGLPVITTKVGGLADIFKEGVNGHFIEINNVDDIVSKIEKLVCDSDLMQNMAITNFKMACDKFRSDKVAKRMIKIYERTIYE